MHPYYKCDTHENQPKPATMKRYHYPPSLSLPNPISRQSAHLVSDHTNLLESIVQNAGLRLVDGVNPRLVSIEHVVCRDADGVRDARLFVLAHTRALGRVGVA